MPVAQWKEQVTHNHSVVGSNPTGRTTSVIAGNYEQYRFHMAQRKLIPCGKQLIFGGILLVVPQRSIGDLCV